MKIEQLEKWLKLSAPGDRFCYHEGLLMADRQENEVLDLLARRVLWEALQERVEVVQQRIDKGKCKYLAIKKGASW